MRRIGNYTAFFGAEVLTSLTRVRDALSQD